METKVKVPESYEEAMNSPEEEQWRAAQNEEFEAINQLGVFEEVLIEKHMKLITCKWVYDIKKNSRGLIDCFRARLVARGFTQQIGVDVWETFSPTVMATTIRTFITVSKCKRMMIHQMDVSKAFLHGDIDGDIFVQPPKPFSTPGKCWKLHKALYGLKQSPRLWMRKLNQILISLGFQPTKSDGCLFRQKIGDLMVLLLVYVDDILIATNDEKVMLQVKQKLKSKLNIKDMNEIRKFLGIQFVNDSQLPYVTASQRQFIEELALKYNMV